MRSSNIFYNHRYHVAFTSNATNNIFCTGNSIFSTIFRMHILFCTHLQTSFDLRSNTSHRFFNSIRNTGQ